MKTANETSSTKARLDRRAFFASSAAASAFMVLPRRVLGGPGQVSPNEKLNIAGIGIGEQGGSEMSFALLKAVKVFLPSSG
jgi:hypothetical protein